MADFQDQQQLEWQVNTSAEDVHYSYRVEAECIDMGDNCNPNSDQHCSISAFGQESGGESLVINVIATSVEDVCRQLSERGLEFPIKSIKKFAKPPFKEDQELLGWDNSMCNILTEVSLTYEDCVSFIPPTNTPTVFMVVDTTIAFIAAAGKLTGGTGTLAGGSASISGGAEMVAPSYQFIGSGLIEVSGGSDISSTSDQGILNVDMTMTTSMELTVMFGTTEGDPLLPVPNEPLVAVNCDCGPLSPYLDYTMNLIRGYNPFERFLQRNAIAFPETGQMIYNSGIFAWESNWAYEGYGIKGDEQELWTVNLQLSCINQLGATTFGQSAFWVFSLFISQQNITTGKKKISKILASFGSGGLCTEVGIIFGFTFNTQTGAVTPDNENVLVNYISSVDEIGLFTTETWKEDPDLRIRLTQLIVELGTSRLDITPLYPEEEPVLVAETEPGVFTDA